MIREIEEKDYREAVAVIKESFMTVADEFGITEENAPRYVAFATDEEKLRSWRDEQHRPMFGFFKDDKMVGYYNLCITGDECELGSLSVLPEYRHGKIGKQLLDDAISRAKSLGCKTMKLSIVEENQLLRKWYEDQGFIHEGTEKFDFFPFTCGYMKKDLSVQPMAGSANVSEAGTSDINESENISGGTAALAAGAIAGSEAASAADGASPQKAPVQKKKKVKLTRAEKKAARKERKKRWKETRKEDREKLKEHYKDAPWFIRIPRMIAFPLLQVALVLSAALAVLFTGVLALAVIGVCGYFGLMFYYTDLYENRNEPVEREDILALSPIDEEGAEKIAAIPDIDPDDTWTICVYMVGADLEDMYENDLSLTTMYQTAKEKNARNAEETEEIFSLLDQYSTELNSNGLELPEYLYYPDPPTESYSEYVTNDVVVADMEGCASTDIYEMVEAETPDNISIVVQTGGATRWSNTFINPNKTQRFLIKNGGFEELENLPLQRSTDPQTLADFIEYCDDNFESDHKMLILWDHGSGPFGYGADSIYGGKSMSLKDIREALSMVYEPDMEDPAFDIIGFDACLMSNLEVTHALNGFASYYALSEETEPGEGWDYVGWLTAMKDDPAMSPAAVAQAVADTYTDFYMTQNVNIGEQLFTSDVTFAVLDAAKAEELYDAYCDLAEKQLIDSAGDISVLAEIGRCCNKSTHVVSDSYSMFNLVDLGNYIEHMADTYPDECAEIDRLMEETILYHRESGSLCDSEGISVYIPGSIDSFAGLWYFLDYEYNICEDDNIRALYYYKMSGCLNDEMQDRLAEMTDETPLVLDVSDFYVFEKTDPMIADNTFSVPVSENLQKMIQGYSFLLASYDEESDTIVYYGEDEYMYLDGDGNICSEFDGEWIFMDGQPLCIEITSATYSVVEYRSRVRYEGQEAYLVFAYNRDTEEFSIKGIRLIPEEESDGINFMVSTKNNIELQPGDEIIPLYYSTDAYGQSFDTEGKSITYRVTMDIKMDGMPSGYYLGMATIYDQRGDSYNSAVIGYDISGGKVKECSIDEDFVGTDY